MSNWSKSPHRRQSPVSARLVVAVGPVPPPMHGAARVNAMIVEAVRATGAHVRIVDTAVDVESRLGYHLARTVRHVGAVAVLVVLALRHPRRGRICYLTGAGGLGLWYQLAVVVAARLLGFSIVFHHHSFAYLTSRPTVMDLLCRSGGRRMTHVALCPRMGELLSGMYPSAETVVVCSNAGLYPPTEDPPTDRATFEGLVCAHLSNLTVAKGLPTVFDTFRRLSRAVPSVRLVLGGPAADSSAASLISEAQAEFGSRLDYVGPVRSDAVDQFFSRADIMLFPSTYSNEAEPLVVIEAARCGVATLAYDVGCLRSLVLGPDWVVPVGEDFGSRAEHLLAGLDDAAVALIRRRAFDHFARLRADAVDRVDALVVLLTT